MEPSIPVDPYAAFAVRVSLEGRHVAGFSQVAGLEPAVQADVVRRRGGRLVPVTDRPGGPGPRVVTLRRGLTRDPGFQQWAGEAERWADGEVEGARGGPVPLQESRRDLAIEVVDEGGRVVRAYKVSGGWVSEFHAVPGLGADANDVAIETMTLGCERWERDPEVGLAETEPDEP